MIYNANAFNGAVAKDDLNLDHAVVALALRRIRSRGVCRLRQRGAERAYAKGEQKEQCNEFLHAKYLLSMMFPTERFEHTSGSRYRVKTVVKKILKKLLIRK